MCGKCVVLTYDEVLDLVMRMEVSGPVAAAEWPARACGAMAFPNSAVPLIVPGEGARWSPLSVAGEESGRQLHVASGEGAARSPFPAFDEGSSPQPFVPGDLQVRGMRWGFEEPWKPGVVFNTRIESAGRPMWRDSMEHRRCIIPVCSFFETSATETVPSPRTGRPMRRSFEFAEPNGQVTFVGGVWRGDRFSMVTTEANRWMAPVHHRMPLVLRPDELAQWLGPDYLRLADRSSVELAVRDASEAAPPNNNGMTPLF